MSDTGKKVGSINHYYDKIGVGIFKLEDALKVGDKVLIKGTTTELEQDITEMQYDHKNIESADAGQEVGVKVDEKVRSGDEVFLAQ